MLERAGYNLGLLTGHEPFATTAAGRLLHEQLEPPVRCFRSGPCGSDQQIGARRLNDTVCVCTGEVRTPRDPARPGLSCTEQVDVGVVPLSHRFVWAVSGFV